ncbi:MAG TPA: bifunctional UDP-N-acetylglucosamine diphosphorylase/glucosamine-1-phosphate N-acetyltransferase GlmU [Methylomirabilota bacterium]|nr:bifunctional UDP-N-acetylglucosamine diphosphorylase/glucosamine-1-phosphate N-acetyltransferase GlmU [Methylomirabilota bacterium]
MANPTAAAVVLAAGKGVRMRTSLPKVMHPLAGRPLINHVLANLAPVGCDPVVVVIGPGQESVAKAVAPHRTVVQSQPLGTGHAVLAARAALADFAGDVLVVYGDCPFITSATIGRLLARRRQPDDPAAVVLGMRPSDPAEYGRLIVGAQGGLEAIVEFRDATPEQRAIKLVNSGVMAIDGRRLFGLLDRVGNANAKGEYYLTDIVGLARKDGAACAVVEAPAIELLGINSRAELASAEAILQDHLRLRAMANGATLRDPRTVYFSYDTRLGSDVVVGPSVVFGPGVTVEDGVEIKAFSHIEGARIARGAVIGPFARLRPGTVIGEKAHIGNFVEAKNATVGPGAKANHLTYLGDAVVGAAANVGAGTITANYDGFDKYRTEIGARASIGSNTVLVAPVQVGEGAIVAAGSVVTTKVSPDALVVARGRQTEKPGWAAKFREMKKAARNAAVLRHGDKAFTVAVTKSDGTAVPVDPAKLSVVTTKRPEPSAAPPGAAATPAPAPPPSTTPAPAAKRPAKAKPPRGNGKAAPKAMAKPSPKPAPTPKRPAAKKAAKAKKPAPPAKKPVAAAKARRR